RLVTPFHRSLGDAQSTLTALCSVPSATRLAGFAWRTDTFLTSEFVGITVCCPDALRIQVSQSGVLIMAKGQVRGNREAKKPKQPPKPVAPAAGPGSIPAKGNRPSEPNRK